MGAPQPPPPRHGSPYRLKDWPGAGVTPRFAAAMRAPLKGDDKAHFAGGDRATRPGQFRADSKQEAGRGLGVGAVPPPPTAHPHSLAAASRGPGCRPGPGPQAHSWRPGLFAQHGVCQTQFPRSQPLLKTDSSEFSSLFWHRKKNVISNLKFEKNIILIKMHSAQMVFGKLALSLLLVPARGPAVGTGSPCPPPLLATGGDTEPACRQGGGRVSGNSGEQSGGGRESRHLEQSCRGGEEGEAGRARRPPQASGSAGRGEGPGAHSWLPPRNSWVGNRLQV